MANGTQTPDVLTDPKFFALPESDQTKILSRVDPKFGSLPDSDKQIILKKRRSDFQLRAPAPAPPKPAASDEDVHWYTELGTKAVNAVESVLPGHRAGGGAPIDEERNAKAQEEFRLAHAGDNLPPKPASAPAASKSVSPPQPKAGETEVPFRIGMGAEVPVLQPLAQEVHDRLYSLLKPEEIAKIEKALAIDPDTAEIIQEQFGKKKFKQQVPVFGMPGQTQEIEIEAPDATETATFARAAISSLSQWYSPALLALQGLGHLSSLATETVGKGGVEAVQTARRAQASWQAATRAGTDAERFRLVDEGNKLAEDAYKAGKNYEDARKFAAAVRIANATVGAGFTVYQAADAVKLYHEGKYPEALSALGGAVAAGFMTALGAYGIPKLMERKFGPMVSPPRVEYTPERAKLGESGTSGPPKPSAQAGRPSAPPATPHLDNAVASPEPGRKWSDVLVDKGNLVSSKGGVDHYTVGDRHVIVNEGNVYERPAKAAPRFANSLRKANELKENVPGAHLDNAVGSPSPGEKWSDFLLDKADLVESKDGIDHYKRGGMHYIVEPTGAVHTVKGPEGQRFFDTLARAEKFKAHEDEPTKPPAPTAGLHKFSSTQLDLPEGTTAPLLSKIDPNDLAGEGAVKDPHVTVKYGLHDETPEGLQKYLETKGPITLTMGKTKVFPPSPSSDGQDVVYVEVDSPQLHDINRDITNQFKVTDSHPEYRPHITLAYVKPGMGEKYAGLSDLEGKTVTIGDVQFMSKSGEQTTIPLAGRPPAPESGKAPKPQGGTPTAVPPPASAERRGAPRPAGTPALDLATRHEVRTLMQLDPSITFDEAVQATMDAREAAKNAKPVERVKGLPRPPKPASVEPPKPSSLRTYDEVQEDIDKLEDDPEEVVRRIKEGIPDTPELQALYAERDAIGGAELKQSIDEISSALDESGFPPKEVRLILKAFSLDPDDLSAGAQYMAGEHGPKNVSEFGYAKRRAQDIAISLAMERSPLGGREIGDVTDIRDPKVLADAKRAVNVIYQHITGNEDIFDDAKKAGEPPVPKAYRKAPPELTAVLHKEPPVPASAKGQEDWVLDVAKKARKAGVTSKGFRTTMMKDHGVDKAHLNRVVKEVWGKEEKAAAEPPAVASPEPAPAEAPTLAGIEFHDRGGATVTDPVAFTVSLAAGAAPPLGYVFMPTEALTLVPEEMQFRTEKGLIERKQERAGIDVWNPDLAGAVDVWFDPTDRKIKVVNGHHRTESALRLGTPSLKVEFIDAPTAQAAHAWGALKNIGEGSATPFDAAVFFRATGETPEDLARHGISLARKVVSQGMALRNLSPELFERVRNGTMSDETGAAIGSSLVSHDLQRGLADIVDREEKRGNPLSADEIKTLAEGRVQRAGETVHTEKTLFGDKVVTESNAVEAARLENWVKKRLTAEKNIFSSVSNDRKESVLTGAGNVLNSRENRKLAEALGAAKDAFAKMLYKKNDVDDAILDGAARIAQGEDADVVREDTYRRVREAIQKALAGGKGVVEQVGGGVPGGGAETPQGAGAAAGAAPAGAGKEVEPALPGLQPAIEAQKAAAGAEAGRQLTDRFNEAPKSVTAETGKVETQPLFRGTEAVPQREMFSTPPKPAGAYTLGIGESGQVEWKPPKPVSEGEPPPPSAELRKGPGGKTAGGTEVEGSTTEQLTEAIRSARHASRHEKPVEPPPFEAGAKSRPKTAEVISGMRGLVDRAWQKYSEPAPTGTYQELKGAWQGPLQHTMHDLYGFEKQVKKALPDKGRRQAMSDWIEADGDRQVLLERANSFKGASRKSYQTAATLTDEEKSDARNFHNAWEDGWRTGHEAGALEGHVENYVLHLWRRNRLAASRIMAQVTGAILRKDFPYAKHRTVATYYEGELGKDGRKPMEPVDKDVAFLYAMWVRSLSKAIAGRKFVFDLLHNYHEDGKPLAVVSGGRYILEDRNGKRALIVNPEISPKEAVSADGKRYREIDHPALRKGMYIGRQADGSPIYLQSKIIVHPAIFDDLNNVLSSSKFRDPNASWLWRTGGFVLDASTFVKQTMLGPLSTFHQVQVGIHGLMHGVNVFNPAKIDWNDPRVLKLVNAGVMVANPDGSVRFEEGLVAGGLWDSLNVDVRGMHINPGERLQDYKAYLFQDYIPRLKMEMALKALDRNQKAYGKKLSESQIYSLTANESNAAFGELNYVMMGRSKTMQDALRLIMLSPDFTESRARFVGQAFKLHGREQRIALAKGAIGLAVTAGAIAGILKYAFPGTKVDWNWHDPFSVRVGEWEVDVRSLPGDIISAVKEPGQFLRARENPMTTRIVHEWAFGTDWRGQPRTFGEQVQDAFYAVVPLSLQGLTEPDRRWWQSALGAVGIRVRKFYSPAGKLALQIHGEDIAGRSRRHETPEALKSREDVAKLFHSLNDGVPIPAVKIEELKQAGEISPFTELRLKNAKPGQDSFLNIFASLGLEDKMDVWDKADADERKKLAPEMVMTRREAGSLNSMPPKQRDAVMARYKRVRKQAERPEPDRGIAGQAEHIFDKIFAPIPSGSARPPVPVGDNAAP